jgi:hypothetical protein
MLKIILIMFNCDSFRILMAHTEDPRHCTP